MTDAVAPITSFRGEYAFLSNFYPARIALDGITYPTAEHAYQALKTDDPIDRRRIAGAPTPAAAKAMGRNVRMGSGQHPPDRMRRVLTAKFAIPKLRYALIATAPAQLIEGNHWGDVYWGVCDGRGSNYLGQLLMEVRDRAIECRVSHVLGP